LLRWKRREVKKGGKKSYDSATLQHTHSEHSAPNSPSFRVFPVYGRTQDVCP
jgi:hypothetical protein